MKRFFLISILLLSIESLPARSFSKGALTGGIIGGFAAGALIGSAIKKRQYRRRYYDYPPCNYNYYKSYKHNNYNPYL